MENEKNLVIYQAENGAIELQADLTDETVWVTQKQLSDIFDVNVRTVSEHIKNILKTKELEENSVIRKFRITATDGKSYNTNHYNLDMVISVGYRVNSKTATQFRKWATQTLKEHITKGYTINPTRISKNYDAFMQAVDDIQKLASAQSQLQSENVLALVKSFANTWFSLESYDEDKLPQTGLTSKDISIEAQHLAVAVTQLKNTLIDKKQATPLFAQEKREGALAGILGSVFQTVFGQDAYPTIEEKAAHLLYFIVKNHPFNDGNKRTAAFSFIWFLQKAGLEFESKITPEALTAITLLIAESKPESKDRMIGLVILLLTGEPIE
ncbi:virulence protein RhuM/Fic/DOC family protein [Alkalimarinus sediminis]|uniref:Type II toxin-antitoxin system death-on-curing family toxin n=1 Tax=Alkalimarinus sediminis TaxID=1632866 RepID=A0A9E8KJF5_9ALTE|nr:virulence protein RhuM/Fic/DOC family protein [Alkalimarinus sediminis]UZW74991.1 type II toxin-antitoxin system death-on-curing family toxin [Alkalimarinus sediminis]